MNPESLGSITQAPFIVAAVALIKPFIPDSRFYPLVVLGIAIAVNVLYAGATGHNLWQGAIDGLIAGLTASGLYSQGKAAIGR